MNATKMLLAFTDPNGWRTLDPNDRSFPIPSPYRMTVLELLGPDDCVLIV